MPEFQEFLEALDTDPSNAVALAQIEALGSQLLEDEHAHTALDRARKSLRQRGALEVVAKLFDVEIQAARDSSRRADLLLEKGQLLADDLLEEESAVECFNEVLKLRPDDEAAQEILANFDLFRENWKKFADKYLEEARVSTDRGLTTSMYLSAAKIYARYQPGASEIEDFLRKALDADPRNREAAVHLERLLRRAGRSDDLLALFEQRSELAAAPDERVHALLGIAELAAGPLERPELALESMKKILAIDPAHGRALQLLADDYEREENWSALVMMYTGALKAQRRAGARDGDLGMLLQVAMIQWKRLGNEEAAEEYFRRVRKIDPAHPAALDFYRHFYPSRGESAKLLQVLRQAQRATDDPSRVRGLAVEMAELSEHQLGNPEKSIDAWKAILRADPDAADAREALRRLYRKKEGWNALLDLMKDDIERLPKSDVEGRVALLMEVVEIYRDRLKLPPMVINTYNGILKLDPHNNQALDDLVGIYKELGKWNDLIAILGQKAEDDRAPVAERVTVLREIADLWCERFGNYAQAIKPLEQLVDIAPDDDDARNRLKDIYTRRRQWRALINLLGTEARRKSVGERRDAVANMARLASERLGDYRLAIELWNRVLELPGGDADAEAVGALAQLYEREKRYLPLAEIYRRQVDLADGDPAAQVQALEKLGALLADRVEAPARAADALRRILEIDPGHGRATRTLRDLYAAARDFDALERLYAAGGQWDELVDVLSNVADRIDEKDAKLAVLERAAATAAAHSQSKDRMARAWERVLAVAPDHVGAARALVPVYRDTGKWARLLSTYETMLVHAGSPAEKLELHDEIRRLAEQNLGSKALAFQWAARAFELDPRDSRRLADLERLGGEADAWSDVADLLDRRAQAEELGEGERLALLRELGKIALVRLHQPEKARGYQQRVLELAPDDPAAIEALEEIATQLSDWPDLLEVYRRRVKSEKDADARIDLLFRIAFIEEERVADLDAAAITYSEILDYRPESQRALRALSKIQEARGDWEGLARVLEREIEQAKSGDARFDLTMHLGRLLENSLERPADALVRYREAFALSSGRREAHEALERYLDSVELDAVARVGVAELMLPVYESADDPTKIAHAVEVLRGGADVNGRLGYDRRLVALYGDRLGDTRGAYQAALRVLEQAPGDRGNRALLRQFATALGVEEELAGRMEAALASCDERAIDPGEQRALASELALLVGDVLGDNDRAEKAWTSVLALEPTDDAAYDALERIYRAADRWADVRELLARREQNTMDGAARVRHLLAICDLYETVIEDQPGAIAAFRKVLEIDPTQVRAYKALEQLLAEAEKWRELEQLLNDELDYVEGQDNIDTTYKRALVRARHLGDVGGAVDLLEDVVSRHRSHSDGRELLEELLPEADVRLRVARVLEPLYEADGLWKDLCLVLRAQRDLSQSPHEAVDLLTRIANVEERELDLPKAAFDSWVEAMRVEPSISETRASARRLAGSLDRWPALAEVYEALLADNKLSDLILRGELLRELADVYDHEMSDPERATSAYRRLLDLDPGNPDTARPAAIALDRLYSEAQAWPELIEVVRRRAEWADHGTERADLLARLAVICEEQQGDPEAAVAAWRELMAEDPDDLRAIDSLERLFAGAGQYRELIDILRRRVERAPDPDERVALLRRIAFLHEEQLGEPTDAIAAHLEALDHAPDDTATLRELARLYGAGERWFDLYEVIERQLASGGDTEARVALTYQLAQLLQEHLDRPAEALERLAEVLALDPGHAEALSALERMVEHEDLRLRAAEVLEPIYASGAEFGKLAALLRRVADAAQDPRERLRQLIRVMELQEQQLGDKEAALAACAEAVRAAVAEPELPSLLKSLDRLAAELGREDELIGIFEAIAPDILDGDLQRRLYLDIADLARALRDDVSLARNYYQRVLDGAPDDPRALAALESIYRVGGEHEVLVEVLTRKAEMAGDDYRVRVGALLEAATLCAGDLGRADDAIMAFEQVLQIAPDNKDAARELEKLYEKGERWHELVNLIERRLGYAFTVEEAVALRFRLGEIYEHQLLDPDAAVENYSAALGGDPGHAGASAALERALDDPGTRSGAAEVLEPIYVSRQDWPKLVRIYEIKLDAAEDPGERLRLTRYIARLYEDQLEDLEGAFRWYGRVFREEPADRGIRDQLSRLAHILESWEALANIYQEYLDDEPGNVPEAREVALTLAELYDRRLDEVELGQAAYRRVLTNDPDDADTFERLESMLRRAQRWYALVNVYEEIIRTSMDDERRRVLQLRMARVYRDSLKDNARAIDSFRAVLDLEPDDREACEELEELYEGQSQWYELAELLSSRIERAVDAAARVPLRLRLAEIREDHLDDLQGAIDQYEAMLEEHAGREQAIPELERLVVTEAARERIADLLEPIYRENDWWQKLVVILDAKLQYVDDPERRVGMLREIAQIHESRGGDERLALRALCDAWKAHPASEDVLAELAALAAKLGAWDDLIDTLETGIADSYDYDLNGRVLARIADVHEQRRDDPAKAIAAWKRALEVEPDEPNALAALDRLYTTVEDWRALAGVLARRADRADSDADRVSLLHRAAEVHETRLDSPTDAVSAYKGALAVDDADAVALDALERLHGAAGEWSEVAQILARKIELAAEPATRRQLRFTAADVAESHLNDAYEAIGQLTEVLGEDPSDIEALAGLDRLNEGEKMWPELVDIIDRRAALESDAGARAELGFRAARAVEKELFDVHQALERYTAVLEIDPAHEGSRRALDALTKNEDTLEPAAAVLERLLVAESDWDAVAELYERRLAGPAHDLDARRAQYARLAEIHESNRSDPATAFAVLARALAEAPDDARVQGELDRLAAARGAWEELAALYEERLADTMDAQLEYDFAVKLASIYEEALGDLDRAAERYRRALSVGNDESEALAALDRIFGRAGRFADLAEILVREADATLDAQEQGEFLFRLGDVREQSLADALGAVSAYHDVLDRVPGHTAARGALERLLSNEDVRREVIAILEPLYESEGEFGRLADLLTAKLGVTDDAFDRAQIYQRIAEIAERELADPVRALDAAGGWLAEDPRSEEALRELDRLGEVCNRWDEVAARIRGIIESADAEDVRKPLMLALGDVQLSNQGDAAAAEATYRAVLDLDAECGPALVALDRIYRQRGDAAALADILWRRAELAMDAAHKRNAYVEVAGLREQLGDPAGAISAWRQVLDADEGDRDAHDRLAALYEQTRAWHELIDILGVASRFAGDPGRETELRTRIAQIYTRTLEDLDSAVDAWQAVLDVDPESPMAIEALLDVHARRQDWLAVQDVLTRKLDLARTDAERVDIYVQMADLASNQREAPDDAIGFLFQVLEIDNAQFDTYKRLERVLAKAERWHDLVELLEREADVLGTLGQTRDEVACLARAADVLEGPLDDPDGAGELLEKILRREPSYVPALTRLSKIYESAGDWDRCGEVLQQAAQLGPQGSDAADLYFRLGEVERQKSGDSAAAREHWTRALGFDSHHAQTVAAFEAMAREDEDWALVADMLSRREATCEDPEEKLELTLELANLYGVKLGQPQQVIPLLERAVKVAPDDGRVLAPLADLYFAAGDHGRAAPIYKRLAEEAKKKRRMKDVARYGQRLGGILEAQGDADGALAAYEEAFRVNPTDTMTMAGLGRIYMARQTWDKARRVYRSMVLQNLDPDLGITKAEVYYCLGLIHAQLGEVPKAKGMFQRGLELEPDNAKIRQALDQL